MFLLLGKPVVTYNNIAPKNYLLNINNAELLESSIEKALQKPLQLMEHIEKFINMTHPYKDSRSSIRVLNAADEVVSGKLSLGKKPIDFFRQFKMRKKLKYWQV